MCHYTHLTPFEREKILFFLAEGKSVTEIAHLLDRSKSTISRELRRNAASADQPMSYCPLTAQALYKRRREACRPHKRLEYAPLYSYIQICILEYHWSPARQRPDHLPRYPRGPAEPARGFSEVCTSEATASRETASQERQRRASWQVRHIAPHRRSPYQRSEPFRPRSLGSGYRVGKQGKACLVTLMDRKSRYLLGGKAMSKTAAAVNKVMYEALSGQSHLSVTPDRGKEFSKHAQLRKELKRVTFYFPAPHHPWERGTNENTNGLLREFFPKDKNITDTPEDYIQRKYHELNLRHRKCLGYKTPYEIYFSKVLHLT